METNQDNRELIYDALYKAFPNDAENLFKLCQHGLEQPLGSNHPFIIQEIMNNRIDKRDFEKIQIGYVMITAYYFLLDAVVDIQAECGVILTLFLCAALRPCVLYATTYENRFLFFPFFFWNMFYL